MIDTSRNGVGPWDAPDGVYSDAEDWCNPPARGLGERPTTTTGTPLVDAYLWIKVPGESDGQCYRGTGGPTDPERGTQDPAAGLWFAEQARELIEFANPPLAALDCHVSWDAAGAGKAFSAKLRVDGATGLPLTFVWSGDQQAAKATNGVVTQAGHHVTVTANARQAGQGSRRRAERERLGRAALDLLAERRGLHVRLIPPERRGPVRRSPPLFGCLGWVNQSSAAGGAPGSVPKGGTPPAHDEADRRTPHTEAGTAPARQTRRSEVPATIPAAADPERAGWMLGA